MVDVWLMCGDVRFSGTPLLAVDFHRWKVYTCETTLHGVGIIRRKEDPSCNLKVFRIDTVHYNWPMSVHASQAFSVAHCTDLEDLPKINPAK